MNIELEERELDYIEKSVVKSLRASRKNLSHTKDEKTLDEIKESMNFKSSLLKKIRDCRINK